MFTFSMPANNPRHTLRVVSAIDGKVCIQITNRFNDDDITAQFHLSEAQIRLLKQALDLQLEDAKADQKIIEDLENQISMRSPLINEAV